MSIGIPFFMMRYLYTFFFLLISTVALTQDTTEVDIEHAKKFGFIVGASYSNMGFESKAYFVNSAGTAGKSNIRNSAGVSAGFCYYFRLNQWILLRPSVEGNMMPVKIEYDTEINHRVHSNVFPLTVESPLCLIVSKENNPGIKNNRRLPDFNFAVRPVFAVAALAEIRPTLKTFNLNIDLGIGLPITIDKITMRAELFYSYGMNNLIGTNDKDFKTSTISYIGRSYTGLRLYFN